MGKEKEQKQEVRMVPIAEVDDRFEDYWVRSDGEIQEWGTGKIVPVYKNGTVRLRHVNGTSTTVLAHRLVAQAFVPNPNGYKYVRFKDGNSKNRRAENLEWFKAINPMSKETKEILLLKERGTPTRMIAEMFNKSPQYINRVWNRYKKKREN